MVPGVGLEPTRIAPPDPKSGASASSATRAINRKLFIQLLKQNGKPKLKRNHAVVLEAALLLAFASRIFFRRRRDFGVTSTYSSDEIYSKERSRVIFDGGAS